MYCPLNPIALRAPNPVAVPARRLTNTQFSMDELTAIVQEAEAAGTYVAAHAYTPPAITRALAAGVRSIEHGNWLDGDTAELMAADGAFLVPTTVTYQALQREGVAAGMAEELVAKVGEAVSKVRVLTERTQKVKIKRAEAAQPSCCVGYMANSCGPQHLT